jgi:hypothetical protein
MWPRPLSTTPPSRGASRSPATRPPCASMRAAQAAEHCTAPWLCIREEGVLSPAVRPDQAPAHFATVHPGKKPDRPERRPLLVDWGGGGRRDGVVGEAGQEHGVVAGLVCGEVGDCDVAAVDGLSVLRGLRPACQTC